MSPLEAGQASRGLNPPHLRFPGMSQAVLSNDTLHVSGQVGLGPDGALVGENDMGAQTTQALANLGSALELAGLGPRDVVKYTCFIVDSGDFEAFARARAAFFGDHEPAATTVVVAGLLDPRMLVEIEAVAVRNGGTS
ncbi:MAG: RidA family protein [Nocardioidaceae bacterium]|nr:RidA family protein [Nocardioidaceae bacterium]